jgi:hypothetical protein
MASNTGGPSTDIRRLDVFVGTNIMGCAYSTDGIGQTHPGLSHQPSTATSDLNPETGIVRMYRKGYGGCFGRGHWR